MKKGKLITIEGTDASGKATQTKLLYKRLNSENILVERSTFPRYETPTGRIVGGALQGKPEMCESWFSEGPGNVSFIVASLLYAADREYNRDFLDNTLNSGKHMILDRYVQSNMAHQGGKIEDFNERQKHYKFIESLEYGLLNLPKPDLTIFLYVPFEKGIELKSKMNVPIDEAEKDHVYLKNSERTYLELADLYGWKKIDCIENGNLRAINDIHEEIYTHVKKLFS